MGGYALERRRHWAVWMREPAGATIATCDQSAPRKPSPTSSSSDHGILQIFRSRWMQENSSLTPRAGVLLCWPSIVGKPPPQPSQSAPPPHPSQALQPEHPLLHVCASRIITSARDTDLSMVTFCFGAELTQGSSRRRSDDAPTAHLPILPPRPHDGQGAPEACNISTTQARRVGETTATLSTLVRRLTTTTLALYTRGV